MRTNEPFASFRRRFARSYFILAFAIVVVATVVATWVGALTLVFSVNDSLATTAARLREKVQANREVNNTIDDYGASLAISEARPHIRIVPIDSHHNALVGERPRSNNPAVALATLLGVQHVSVDADEGFFLVVPDFDWLAGIFTRFGLAALAIVLLAAAAAIWISRRVANAAVAPLVAVTNSLTEIAGGDFVPQPVIAPNDDLSELTAAYNSVAFTLREATAERERSQMQMRQFIADAGHELRTPLTVVMGYLDALRSGVVRDPEGVSRIYDTIAGESRRMKTVIERLIFLARLERETSQAVPVSVDLCEILDEVIARLRPVAGGRLAYARAEHAPIVADPAELGEGLKNVVDNALRYAPDSPVHVDVRINDGIAEVSIADRGPGMSEVDLEHAFDRFYRGESRGEAEGSGLGLAITKRAVERAGGAVNLQSEAGKGTIVTVTLPLVAAG